MLAKSPDHRPTMLDVAHRLEFIRDELRESQRKALMETPTCATVAPTVVPIDPTDLAAVQQARRSAKGLAKTISSERRIRARRWRWAAGVTALSAGATVFLVIRLGEPAVATASARNPAVNDVDAGGTSVEPSVVDPIAPPNTVPSMSASGGSAAVAATPPIVRSVVQRHRHHKIRSSKPPVWATNIDPDGTLDPYPQR